METVTVITRHTSPTPPGSSFYVRTRRADMAKTIEKTRTRKKKRPEMVDREIQSDRLDDPTRSSRFGSTARASTLTNWSLYTPSATSYTGYAGRYSTQHSSLRDNSTNNSYNDRSSRSVSTEPHPRDIESSSPSIEKKLTSPPNIIESNQDITLYGQNKDDETSEIIINVNLKLKRAKSPLAVASAELVSPEITITNSQLPPQVPKNESITKPKKVKVRKTSSDSSTDSSTKKKVIKRKSKSGSSSDSDQTSETVDKSKENKSVSPPKAIQKTPSGSNLSNGHMRLKHSKSRESNSPESSITLSTQSSLSEEDMTPKSKTNEVSRTSADEVSIPTDRSAKQQSPVSHKTEGATEEAKSFLIRALAPVTSLFKRHQDSNDSRWLETSTSESTGKDVSNITTESERSKSKNNTDNIVASNDNNLVKLKAIRHIESGERAWWMDSDSEKKNTSTSENQKSPSEKNIPKKIRHIESGERAWWLESNGESKSEKLPPTNGSDNSDNFKIQKKNKYAEDEKPWWLDSCANIPEGIERLTPPRKSSSDSEKSEKFNFFKVRHIESGEQKDWWATSNENSSNSKPEHLNNLSKSNSNQNSLSKSGSCQNSLSKSGSNQPSFPLRRIRHIESEERPWWLASDKNIPEGIEKLPTPPPQEDSDSSDSDEVQVYIPSAQIPPFPLHLDDEPLGDRRSPEGLETPKETEQYEGRMSPYENHRQFRRRGSGTSYQKSADKFVSRYTDIDDILGTSGQIYRPFMDSILARRTGQMPYDDEVCEEIDPTQVRIHDSTAQRPVIKKLRSRSEIIDCRDEDQLDDATLQVFKDGDYGPYLDLDSTLNEQDEELEGLQESRKNAIILRTQLSVRVHAIIERLLHSQGRELRRALFTLKQILQSDKDLVHEFVANKGLDCLMQVSSMADHNYLDYILRALGQILLYVDGMHGVMANKHCIQWLYSLISSKFRHVVKTALKLLLVFVEYTEKNCLLLIDAINTVDTSKGRQPWYNVMKILQDFDASDTELLIYATTLINRCLNSVPDRDMYYDQVDALQDQGMDNIVQLYMSKQGTDLDLLRQLQIFEAVLLYEDGDESGTALKQLDESVINSVHRRSLNLNTSDRRKSKKQQMKDKGNQRYTAGLKQRIQNGTLGHSVTPADALTVIRQKMELPVETMDDRGVLLNREHSIKDLAQRLTSPVSPTTDEKPLRVSDMAGIVSKAKEELAKSQSKEVIKSPTIEKTPKLHEIKISENDLHWEELKKGCLNREFHLCDLDFSDLRQDTDDEMSSPATNAAGIPPPPPPGMFPLVGVPPPPPGSFPPFAKSVPAPPPKHSLSEISNDSDSSTIKKNKKTVKLFWREIQECPPPTVRTKIGGFIWDDLPDVKLDTAMLEHLFESRTNDLIIKKLMEPKRNLILDAKRSNAINIAMKKLPTPQTIKAAIMKMDATVIGREGIEKLLTMLPTEEEKVKIQEAQYANPDLPLGSAEQFLLTLASINELSSRLKLWVFKLDFDNLEKEVAEPLMDLKQGIELLKINKTFKVILSTLRSVGSFLNGSQVRGFRLEYLSKVMEVKDTVHKHPLLYHICEMIIEKFPDSTDFFSEVGPVIRASKVDFDILAANLSKLESDCKASWDHMKRVAKHDSSQIFKTKINEFLTDAAERIILLTIIKKRVMSRYTKFLLFLGVPAVDISKTKPSEFLKVIAEFALEYRTSRERVLQQLEKKANHRERNKTRGKMIIDVANYSAKNGDHTADNALKELLKTDPDTDSLTDGRRKIQVNSRRSLVNGDLSADDEIIESLVRSATTKRRPVTRERRKNRLSDKKNLNRTLDGH
ncbi:FH1/FH2 domain-containing protein 3 isoform X2 [Cydia splendana]|uniref:FH1/FH2 domain-containing protein 3 isoform X2 n=1 Tax=Cydia splendana TaxID=1100963 RepID=UPI00300D9F30